MEYYRELGNWKIIRNVVLFIEKREILFYYVFFNKLSVDILKNKVGYLSCFI